MEHLSEKEKEIKEAILAKIEDGKVMMRPRWHFVLRAALVVLGAVMLFLVILYIVSFIVFATRQSGAFFGPEFGLSGWMALVRSVPWFLVGAAFIFAAILEILVKQYAFAYRKPLIYSVAILVGGVILLGTFAAPFHRGPFRDSRLHRLPPMAESFYENFGMRRQKEISKGVVISCGEAGCIIEDFRGETSTVILTPRVRMMGIDELRPGYEVVILGRSSGTDLYAKAIRFIGESER